MKASDTLKDLEKHALYAKENSVIINVYLETEKALRILNDILAYCKEIRSPFGWEFIDYRTHFVFGWSQIRKEIEDERERKRRLNASRCRCCFGYE